MSWKKILKFDLEQYISTALRKDDSKFVQHVQDLLMHLGAWHVSHDKQTGEVKRYEIKKDALNEFWGSLPEAFKQITFQEIKTNVDFAAMPKEDLNEVNWEQVVVNVAPAIDLIINHADKWLPNLVRGSYNWGDGSGRR